MSNRYFVAFLVLVMLLAPTSALAAPHPSVDASTAASPAFSPPAVGEQQPDEAKIVHVVKRGDTLANIAARYGVSIGSIMRNNGIRNANLIYVGQRLVISGGTGGTGGTPTQPKASGGKWIDINLSRQRLTAFSGDTAVFSAIISSGTRAHPTVVGRFAVRTKVRSQTMSGPGYWLPGVPWVMYFYSGYAIHGTYWHSNFGTPMSHGCINMTINQAKWLYNWAPVGTPVVTHY